MKKIDNSLKLEIIINAGMLALKHFEATGDRSKFKKWNEKYGDIFGCKEAIIEEFKLGVGV